MEFSFEFSVFMFCFVLFTRRFVKEVRFLFVGGEIGF